MLLASVHLEPAITISAAVMVSAVIVWYWNRLGRPNVPVSRRKVRRLSLALMLVAMPMFVRALSFVDPELDKQSYAIAWTAIMLIILMIIAMALMDVINNLRIHANQQLEETTKAAGELAMAIRQRRDDEAGDTRGAATPDSEPTEYRA